MGLFLGLAVGYLFGGTHPIARAESTSEPASALRVTPQGVVMCQPVYLGEDGTWKPWPAPPEVAK